MEESMDIYVVKKDICFTSFVELAWMRRFERF